LSIKRKEIKMRIQFNVTEEEFGKLMEKANAAGEPAVSEYVKNLVFATLGRRNNLSVMFKSLLAAVAALPPGDAFIVRDFIEAPPALVGRYFFEAVADGRVKNVVSVGYDKRRRCEKYVKSGGESVREELQDD
jgi:hypothetical protein